jgi:uncharacterized coiled-coil protein SlyX
VRDNSLMILQSDEMKESQELFNKNIKEALKGLLEVVESQEKDLHTLKLMVTAHSAELDEMKQEIRALKNQMYNNKS